MVRDTRVHQRGWEEKDFPCQWVAQCRGKNLHEGLLYHAVTIVYATGIVLVHCHSLVLYVVYDILLMNLF